MNKQYFFEVEDHLLTNLKPSKFLIELFNSKDKISFPFTMIQKLKSIEQSAKYHPEGNVFNHTMLVVDKAAQLKNESKDKRVFMWAALLHDIGKAETTKIRRGKITSYDHDKVGAQMTKAFLAEFTDDMVFVNKVAALVRYHMQILYVVKDLRFAEIKGMKAATDIDEVALLGLCDRLGRYNVDYEGEKESIEIFLKKCNK